MASPGLGDYFRAVGVIAATRKSVGAALAQGEDVVVWPGGEVDAMRSWAKRDVATLGGRTGFVKQAIRQSLQEAMGSEEIGAMMGPKKAEVVNRAQVKLQARLGGQRQVFLAPTGNYGAGRAADSGTNRCP